MTQQSDSPIIIIKKGKKEKILDEKTLKMFTEEILNYLLEDTRSLEKEKKDYNIRKYWLDVTKVLLEAKKTYYPSVQATADVTDAFGEQLKLWAQTNEEIKMMEKERKKNLAKEGIIESE